MGYRQVIIKKSEKLHFKDNQLIIDKDESSTKVPLEDINYILIEDSSTILTTRLLAELGKNAISLIVCDEKFEPTSISIHIFWNGAVTIMIIPPITMHFPPNRCVRYQFSGSHNAHEIRNPIV